MTNNETLIENTDRWNRIRLIILSVNLDEGSRIKLCSAQHHYLTSVLRQFENAEIYLCDGQGNEVVCRLETSNLKQSVLVVERQSPYKSADAKQQIHIGVGYAPKNRLDWSVEKMTETGVASITPLNSFGTKRSDKFTNAIVKRWIKIAISASAQCGRMTVPTINSVSTLEQWKQSLPSNCYCVQLAPSEKTPLSNVIVKNKNNNPIAVLIGRTSGLDEQEEQVSLEAGFIKAGLGERVLRTETVGAVATSVILATTKEY